MRLKHLTIAALVWCSLQVTADAQRRSTLVEAPTDPRGPTDLTVCSQNLKNYGAFEDSRLKDAKLTIDVHREREKLLVERFATAHCDVIAVQELLGKNEEIAKAALTHLAAKLRTATNRLYDVRVGPPGEGRLTLGFIVANDRAEISNIASYDKVELPKLSDSQKPRLFSRGPLEIQLLAKGAEGQEKVVTLVNFHFKSQRGMGDPTGLEWETFRMEMAEALRRIVERRHKEPFASGTSLLLLVGDRNSNFDVSSARILEGTITLNSFKADGPCRLSKRGMPLCAAGSTFPQRLFSVLTTNPRTKSLPGTFVYKGQFSWLDEILLPAESLSAAWATPTSEAEYASGVVYLPREASDHALVYVRLNW